MAKTEPTTELVTLEQVEDVLLHGGAFDVVDEDAIQQDMIRRILSSETLEQAFADFTTTPAKSLEGVPITINGIAWVKSAFDQGAGVYALLKCSVPDSDDEVIVSMGGKTLMASFVYAQRRAAMPIKGAFVSKASRANPERRFWMFDLAQQ